MGHDTHVAPRFVASLKTCNSQLSTASMTQMPIQFAVVREDPRVESWVVRQYDARRVLLIASGGCSALSLLHWHPELALTLVDPNMAQIHHVRAKVEALQSGRHDAIARRFNVSTSDHQGLSQCGMFERLFDAFRSFLHVFVADRRCIETWFDAAKGPSRAASAFVSTYWPIAFELHFSDVLLEAVFGPAATQHAEPGSYARYFQTRLEEALMQPDAHENYFLHHIFLGHYLSEHPPPFLQSTSAGSRATHALEYIHGALSDVHDLSHFDLIHLSNIFDWMGHEEAQALISHLCARVRPGARILWRQLNNRINRCAMVSPSFTCDPHVDAMLLAMERSYFYEQVHMAVRTEG